MNFALLRMAHMLGGLGQPQQQQQQQPEDDVMSLYSQLYQPQTQATDAYMNTLQNMPQLQEPGKLQRIAGMIAGMGAGSSPEHISMGSMPIGFMGDPMKAAQTTDYVMNQPFHRDMGIWNNRLKAIEPAMTAERNYNNTARQTAYQTANLSINERKAAEIERKNRANEQARNTELGIRQQRADVYALKQSNPHLKLFTPKGGNVMAFDPATGETKDTGISSGSLTDLDRIQLQIEGNIEAARARGTEARTTNQEKPNNELMIDNEGNPWMVNRTTGEVSRLKTREEGQTPPTGLTKPGTSKGTGKTNELLPTQKKVAIYNRAQQVKAKYPKLSQYINLLPGNIVELAPPGRWTGISQADYDKIYDEIFGQDNEPTPTGSTSGRGVNPSSKPDPLGIRR